MRNLTISLDEETAAWARIHAARLDMSVSRMVGELLKRNMREHTEYEQAMRRFFARKPAKLKRAGDRYASRDELHDRRDLR